MTYFHRSNFRRFTVNSAVLPAKKEPIILAEIKPEFPIENEPVTIAEGKKEKVAAASLA